MKLYRLRPTTRPKPGSIRSRQDASTIEWLAILLSFSKAFESLALYKLGSSTLAWLTAVCWLYATVSAIVMEFVHLSESTEEHDKDTRDLITGELPSAVSAGGSGHIILDLPRNFRRSGLWRSMLLFQSFACIGVLIAVFVLLGSQPKDAVYVWVGFQVLWLLCRIAFNQLFPIQPSAYAHEAAIAPERWELAEPDIQRRFFTTLCALSVHIANTHPRGYYSYRQDALELEDILHLYFAANCQLTHELPISSGSDTSSLSSSSSMAPEMKVIGVIGDATFRATNWLHGILDTMEIYDATIVFIELHGQIYAVPAVRVLSDTIQQARALKSTDPEAHYPSFDPRGMGNLGQDSVRWVYWIPIPAPPGEKKERYWLESHGNHILNEFKPIIVSQTELGRFLERGVLNISWTSERETWESLLTARETSRCLFQILKEMTQ